VGKTRKKVTAGVVARDNHNWVAERLFGFSDIKKSLAGQKNLNIRLAIRRNIAEDIFSQWQLACSFFL